MSPSPMNNTDEQMGGGQPASSQTERLGLVAAIEVLKEAVKICAAEPSGNCAYIDGAVNEALGREMVILHFLWAELKDDRYPPQFVAAFSDGEVDAMVEMHEERRGEAEQWYRDFDDDMASCRFFTTIYRVPRPILGAEMWQTEEARAESEAY